MLIGAYGVDKSNILEAIALASAAANSKLNKKFLIMRRICVPDDSGHMRAAFSAGSTEQDITIRLKNEQAVEPPHVLCSGAEPCALCRNLDDNDLGETTLA